MGGSTLLLRTSVDLLKRRHDFGGRAIDLLNGTRHFFRGRCHLLGALADVGAVLQLVGQFRQFLRGLLALIQCNSLLIDSLQRFLAC